MAWGFELGRIYNRRADIHARYGGQQQGGIITPSRHSVIFIITGDAGLEHGYEDRQLPDGTFEYFGEGQFGDMEMLRGNAAIANHVADGKDLLLFRKTTKGLRFEGALVCSGHHFENGKDREGKIRQAVVFELVPLEAVEEATETVPPENNVNLDELRRRAMEAANQRPGRRGTKGSVVERSRNVRDYVVARARGHCEGCKTAAPFMRANGVPYLEPHHIRRLGDGGPDDPHFVIALCPNCHRRVHFGANGENLNAEFMNLMKVIERATG